MREFEEKVSSVFSREIQRLVDEIAWVDRRLLELGEDDSEEARIERILLRSLRNHLVNDLRELGGFSGDPYLYGVPVAEVVEASGMEEATGYS